jgi:hypothetical protein
MAAQVIDTWLKQAKMSDRIRNYICKKEFVLIYPNTFLPINLPRKSGNSRPNGACYTHFFQKLKWWKSHGNGAKYPLSRSDTTLPMISNLNSLTHSAPDVSNPRPTACHMKYTAKPKAIFPILES